jgi:Clostripain family
VLRATPRHRRSRSLPARRLFISRGMLAANPRLRAMLHDDTNGGVLTNREAYGVLKAAFSRSHYAEPVDLIFSDTCLNGMVEVLDQFKEFATVVIGSEDLEPGDGWEYYEWFRLMSAPTAARRRDLGPASDPSV